MGGCRSTGPHEHRGTTWKYDLMKAVDIQKALDIRKTLDNTELVLKLCSNSSMGFMGSVKGLMKPFCCDTLCGLL